CTVPSSEATRSSMRPAPFVVAPACSRSCSVSAPRKLIADLVSFGRRRGAVPILGSGGGKHDGEEYPCALADWTHAPALPVPARARCRSVPGRDRRLLPRGAGDDGPHPLPPSGGGAAGD